MDHQTELIVESLKNRIESLQSQRNLSVKGVENAEEAIKHLGVKGPLGEQTQPNLQVSRRKMNLCLQVLRQLSDFFNNEPRYLIGVHNKLARKEDADDEPSFLDREAQKAQSIQDKGEVRDKSSGPETKTEETKPVEKEDRNNKGDRHTRRKRQSGLRPLKR